MAGKGGWLTAHQLTKNQAMLPSLSTHPLASSVQKKSLQGVGGVFLTKGEWELEVPAQGEATVRLELAASASRSRGGVTRGDATTSLGKQEGGATRGNTTTRQHVKRRWQVKRLQCNENPCNNQPCEWEATAHREVLTHQEGERRHKYQQHDNQPGQTRGVGMLNKSGTCGAEAAAEATATQRWQRSWRMRGGGSGVGGGVGDATCVRVAMVGTASAAWRQHSSSSSVDSAAAAAAAQSTMAAAVAAAAAALQRQR